MFSTSGFLTAWSEPNSFSAGILPRTPLGDLTALQMPQADLKAPLLRGRVENRKER